MVAWAIELPEYDITYALRNSIKSQVLVNFLIELSSTTPKEISQQWILSMDDLSNLKGSGAGIVLEGPWELILDQSLCFSVEAINNQAEYKAMIYSLKLAKEVGVSYLLVRTESQLVDS